MPMGNGTGPNGMGPRTGRGAGYCNGNNMPGSYNRSGFGRRGGGFGAGAGFAGRGFLRGGFRQGFHPGYGVNAGAVTDEEYNQMLREEADYLENRLNSLKKQINASENETEK